jgi:co-chaperonin GroES (HSP10)
MKVLHEFIVRMPKKFKDTIKFGEVELFLDARFNEFANRISEAEIVATPVKFPTGAKEGDMLYFHHHVVLDKRAEIDKDLYRVKYDPEGGYGSQAYAYKDSEDNISVLSGWVFLIADEGKEPTSETGIIISTQKEIKREGVVRFDTPELLEMGVKAGDMVGFSKESDYTMEVNGEKLWRMTPNDLLYVKEAV